MTEPNVQPSAPDKQHRFPCPGCGASLEFAPQEGCLSCPYCGRQERIPATAEEVHERSFEEYLRVRPERLERPDRAMPDLRCESCGATVALGPGQSAGECPFCASNIVIDPGEPKPWVSPEGLLPFRNSLDQAAASVRAWLRSRWFAPNALRRLGQTEAVHGVYLPFWTYDAHSTSHYVGQRGEHYTVTETYTVRNSRGRPETRRRMVRKTRWFPVAGTVSRWFDDLLVPATRSVDLRRLDAIEPWDLATLEAYDPAYLAGFKAQRYEVDLGAGFEEARKMMEGTIRQDVRKDIGGDAQRILSVKTALTGITYKHVLLPVWIASYRFRGKVYQVLVNARSGEVQGDRPYSFWKIAGLVALVLAAVAVAGLIALVR